MTLVSMRHEETFVSTSIEILNDHGVTLEYGHDFEHYRELLKEARPDHTLGAPFDPKLREIDAKDALWIVGRDRAGKIMHTQASRILNLGNMTVGDYFLSQFRNYPPSDVDLDLGRSRYRDSPGSRRMRGRVAYQGEFWIGGEKGAYRGSGLSCILGRFGFWEVMQRLDPDYLVGFILKPVAFRGLAERTGWMHMEPGALQWYMRGEDTPVETFLAYLSREDLYYLLEMPLNELVAQAA